MNRLERQHAEKIDAILRPCMGYLYRLRQRMLKVGFTPDQPIYQFVSDVYDALHALCVRLHYISCDGGTGYGPNRPQ